MGWPPGKPTRARLYCSSPVIVILVPELSRTGAKPPPKRSQPAVDANHVGILGHSEGGIIAPMVAASDSHVAFVVMIAGPAMRGDELFILQSAMTSKSYGVPEDYIARRKVFDRKLYDAILAAPSAAEARKAADAVVAEGMQQKLVDQNEFDGLASNATTAWFRSFIAYDPAPTLTQVKVPISRCLWIAGHSGACHRQLDVGHPRAQG